MSYEDSHCPCGGLKLPYFMLCAACMDHMKDRPEMATFNSSDPVPLRRNAAVILVTLARGRKREMFNTNLSGAASASARKTGSQGEQT